jgi:hypothetical protein
MFSESNLIIGKSYINNLTQIACEVMTLEHGWVRFKMHLLITGERFGRVRECPQEEFLKWADREATPEEMVHLQQNTEELYPTLEYIAKNAPDHSFEEELLVNQAHWTMR